MVRDDVTGECIPIENCPCVEENGERCSAALESFCDDLVRGKGNTMIK